MHVTDENMSSLFEDSVYRVRQEVFPPLLQTS